MGIEGLLIGIVSGIISSVLLSLFLYFVKPKIIISDKLSMEKEEQDVLYVKVINKSRAVLTNVSYTLHFCQKFGDGVIDTIEITPRKPKLTFMDRYEKKDADGKYAIRLSYVLNDRIKQLENDRNYLLFTFIATHPYSGSQFSMSKEYKLCDIKRGLFETGTSTNILQSHYNSTPSRAVK